jgi:tetratricopeptide (TPR) repeat protein
MKIKPIYLYLGAFAVFLIAIIIFSKVTKESGKANPLSANAQAPNDNIHQGMRSRENGKGPSKDDVMKEAVDRMNQLKSDVAKNPNDTAKVKLLADMLVPHEPEQAIKYYEQILKAGPKRIDILLQLTYTYYNMGNVEKAIEFNNRALAQDKNNQYALYNSGGLAQAKGDKQKALKIWKDLANKFPDSEVGHIAKEASKQLEKAK